MITVLDKSKIAAKCERPGCNGTIIESQGEAICLACGRPARVVPVQKTPAPPATVKALPPVPPAPTPHTTVLPPVPPKPRGNISISKYYEDNRQAIEADIANLGVDAAMERWQIGENMLYKLRQRWGLKINIRKPAASHQPAPGLTAAAPAKPLPGLPPFPAFCDTWQPDVQIRWLDAYMVLHSDARGNNHDG